MPALVAPTQPHVIERGDHIYLVAPVGLFEPSAERIEEFAFAQDLKRAAPNPGLVWMRGQYVEADKPNLNKQMWTSDELSIKALTPMFMPVTVMHDPRTAVGLIADAKLLTPEADSIPRARIDTAMALWEHRFPEAVEEARVNAAQGTLMQSMECVAPDYACSECGMNFHKLPDGFERENWCAHLKGEEGSNASRILGNVVFTGTGLIYGTRGARGANPSADLEVFGDELASLHREFHEQASHTGKPNTKRSRSKPNMAEITIEQAEYDRLKAAEARVSDLEKAEKQAEKDVETAEAAKVKAEGERDAEKKEREKAEEKARRSELRDERWGKLGEGFVAKLGDKTKTKLQEQAGTLADDEWTARLEEVSDLTGVKTDAEKDDKTPEGKPKPGKSDEAAEEETFGVEEIAQASFGGSKPEDSTEPSGAQRQSVMKGLFA